MSTVKTPLKESVVSTKNASVFFESTLERLSGLHSSSERRSTFPHLLASPIHYEPGYAYPLLVWLHDAEKTETELFEVAPRISTRNYVVVAPRGLARVQNRVVRSRVNGRLLEEKSWQESCYDWPETDEAVSEAENLVFDSIEQAAANFNVNPRRIFLLGRGSGGTMALRVALRNPREFAGVASIDGAVPPLEKLPLRNWRVARDLPVLITTSDRSSTAVPQLTARQLRLFHTAGMTVVIRQYNEAPGRCTARASETRMNKILADVNCWAMERALNPRTPTSELFERC